MLAILLLAAGAGLPFYVVPPHDWSPRPFLILAGAVAVGLFPPTGRLVLRVTDAIRAPSPRVRGLVAVGVALLASSYLYTTARLQDRDLILKFHDEYMHVLQMRHLAIGRLWMPQLPLPDFFESFHILVKPVYASCYFPGASLMYLPAIWLGLPYWALPLLVSGAVVGMTYRVTTELIDGVAGALSALLLLGATKFRYLSTMVISHPPMALLGLCMIWAWLRWRRERRWYWALALGAAGGWAAITRPADAVAYALPVGVALLLDLRRSTPRLAAAHIAIIVAAAMPFLGLQLVADKGITGRWLYTPYTFALVEQTGQNPFAAAFDPTIRPRSTLPQKIAAHEEFTLPQVREHQQSNLLHVWLHQKLKLVLGYGCANPLLLALLPASLLGLSTAPRVAVCLILPMYVVMYGMFAAMLPHYPVTIAPVFAFVIVLGARALGDGLTARRKFDMAGGGVNSGSNTPSVVLTCCILALALRALPEVNGVILDDPLPMPTLKFVAGELPAIVGTRAVVLFRFEPGDDFHQEPVYNVGVAWPDDAPIIHAHDLGSERNAEIFRYYAERQPDRRFWLFVRRDRNPDGPLLSYLGTARELAARASTVPAPASRTASP